MRKLRQWVSVVAVAVAGIACDGHPRVIADGWHYGGRSDASRAFRDTLLGLSTGVPSVTYDGLDRLGQREDLVTISSGGFTGETWANALLSMGPVSVVVGHPGSAVTNAAARVYAAAGVPLVVPNATARATPDVEDWVFRLLPDDATQGDFLAQYALDSAKAKRVVVVFVGDAFGVGILRGVRSALAARGQPLVDEVELPIGSCDASALAAPRLATRAMLQRARPDAIIIALPYSPANCVIEEVVRARPGTTLIAADGLDDANFDAWLRLVVPSARIRIATGWQPRSDSATAHFIEAFTRAHGGKRPRGDEALLYDALLVAATALRETNGRPARVRDWLASLGRSREPVLGITGPISFTADRGARLFMRTVD